MKRTETHSKCGIHMCVHMCLCESVWWIQVELLFIHLIVIRYDKFSLQCNRLTNIHARCFFNCVCSCVSNTYKRNSMNQCAIAGAYECIYMDFFILTCLPFRYTTHSHIHFHSARFCAVLWFVVNIRIHWTLNILGIYCE